MVTKDENHRCPWADIIKDPEEFIEAEYLPDYDTLVKEPSHLAIAKVRKLLRFWLERQSSRQVPFRWKSVLENGERVNANGPKVNLRKPNTEAIREKGRRSAISSRQKSRRVGLQKAIDSDEDAPAPAAEKKTVKRRRVKKVTRVAPIDNESSGEDFDMREVDVMQYSDHETKQLGNVAESGARYATPDISPDLLPLWKKFTAKLPLECMTWSKEQLQTQFEVFRGWAGLTGLISADAPSVQTVQVNKNAGVGSSAHLDLTAAASLESPIGDVVSASEPHSNEKADVEPSSHLDTAGNVPPKPPQLDTQDTLLPANEKAANDGPKVPANGHVGNARQIAECLNAADDIAEDSKSPSAEPTASPSFKIGGMQTRKRKAELEAHTASKKAKDSEKSGAAGRLTRNVARNGKHSDVVPAVPPKRGRGRPRKNRT